MGWIVTIIVGFIVVLKQFLHPGKDNLGFIMTTLLGIGGSVLAQAVGQGMGWYSVGQPAGWIASPTIAAVVILAVYTRDCEW